MSNQPDRLAHGIDNCLNSDLYAGSEPCYDLDVDKPFNIVVGQNPFGPKEDKKLGCYKSFGFIGSYTDILNIYMFEAYGHMIKTTLEDTIYTDSFYLRDISNYIERCHNNVLVTRESVDEDDEYFKERCEESTDLLGHETTIADFLIELLYEENMARTRLYGQIESNDIVENTGNSCQQEDPVKISDITNSVGNTRPAESSLHRGTNLDLTCRLRDEASEDLVAEGIEPREESSKDHNSDKQKYANDRLNKDNIKLKSVRNDGDKGTEPQCISVKQGETSSDDLQEAIYENGTLIANGDMRGTKNVAVNISSVFEVENNGTIIYDSISSDSNLTSENVSKCLNFDKNNAKSSSRDQAKLNLFLEQPLTEICDLFKNSCLTTCVLTNLPADLTIIDIKLFLDLSFWSKYNLLYLGEKGGEVNTRSYAVINFIEPQYLQIFCSESDTISAFRSRKIKLFYAHVQGLENIKLYIGSHSILQEGYEYWPRLFYTTGENKGEEVDYTSIK